VTWIIQTPAWISLLFSLLKRNDCKCVFEPTWSLCHLSFFPFPWPIFRFLLLFPQLYWNKVFILITLSGQAKFRHNENKKCYAK
jgi:hypothetical protein